MIKTKFLIFIFLLITLFIFPEDFRLIFKENTLDEEANRIWIYINKIKWYEEKGYNIEFPKHKIIRELLKKSRKNELNNDDNKNFLDIFKNEIYDKSLYQKSLEKVKKSENKIIKALIKFKYYKEKWDFKIFDTYTVRLTFYGTGGSYGYNTGEVILWTDSNGSFKRDIDPSHVIIHEMVHIGIEENIVKKYNLSH